MYVMTRFELVTCDLVPTVTSKVLMTSDLHNLIVPSLGYRFNRSTIGCGGY